MKEKNDVNGTSAGKRRGWLGYLGWGAPGLLVLLLVVMVMGAVYQAAASRNSAYCRAAYWEDLTFLGPSSQTDGPASLGDLPLIVL